MLKPVAVMKHLTFLLASLLLIAPALRAANVINTLPNTASNERPLDQSSSQFATAFTTGTAPGKLASITVKLRSITFTNDARVQLWSSATSSNVPTDLVEDLGTRSIPVSGDTDWTFTSTLAPQLDVGARYWVSVAYVTGGGTLYWKNATSSAATTSEGGASMADTRAGSNLAGTSWTFQTDTSTQLFSVTTYNPDIVVTTAADDDNGATNGTSLREALAAAASAAGPDLITFNPSLSGQSIQLITHSTGVQGETALTVNNTEGISIDASSLPDGLTITRPAGASGDGYHTLYLEAGSTLTLRGLTISGFKAPANTQSGAIFSGGTLTLDRCTLIGNTTDYSGGGIYNDGTLKVNQCTLSDNHADNSTGGGGGGGIYNSGTLTVSQSTLSGNHAGSVAGGGGGGIFNQGTMTVSESTLSDNDADSPSGGGGGGGIYNSGTGTLTLSTLSGNHADDASGGGIANVGTLTVSQSTLSGNHANGGGSGGGIWNFFNSTLTLTQSTLASNQAGSGGGIYNFGGSITFTNSIIAGNTSSNNFGPDSFNVSTATRNGVNFIGDLANSGLNASGTLLTGDALLAPLASNGGPTQTMALLPGSPAIHASLSSTTTTDQRGFPIVNTADLGAYESQGSTVTLTSSENPSIFGQSVTFTATVNELDPAVITPTGTVAFRADGNDLGSPVALNGSGIATFTTSTLAAGTPAITATYNGDARLLPSISSTLNQTVIDLSVGNCNDSGNGSLRQALANAAAHPGPDTITLPIGLNGQTLTLLTQLVINDAGGVTIDASGLSNGFTISGGGNVRLFTVNTGSTVTLKNLTLINGKGVGGSLNGAGGAIYNNTGATLTLDGCTLTGHSTNVGGAIFNNGGVLMLNRCTFSDNTANSTGGAIYSVGIGLTAQGCTFSGNTATSSGGALYTGGTASLTNCTFTANAGQDGGGVFNQSGGVLTLTHCTLAVNSATSSGGGIASGIGALTLTNCIVAQNTAASGADISNSGSTPFGTATVTRVGVNIVRSHVNSGNTATDTGPDALNVDPLLNVLGNYGGPTPTMPLLPGSPALDQASVLNPALTTDQRGFPRPGGVRPDLGAVEGSVIVVTTPVDELDAPGALGNGVSLREAVRDVEAGGTVVFDRAVFNSLTTNTITLTKGPLNPQRNCTLNGSLNPGGITILNTLTITQHPLPLSVADDVSASFSVTVTNVSGGLAYQWRKDGSDLAGKTAATLTIFNAQEGDEALYDVTLSEAVSPGTLTLNNVNLSPASGRSQPASLIVNGAPVTIQRGPASAMLALGSSYTLRVDAIGPALPALTYQWTKAGKNIAGATKSSYSITNAQLAHAGAYTCLVKSGATSATSTTAEIGVVDARPKIVNLKEGGTFTPSVSAAGNGLQPFAWRRDATVLPSILKSFTINPVAVADAGLYTCTVTGFAGTITTGFNTLLNVSNAAPSLVTPLNLPAATIGQAYFYQLPVQMFPGRPATSFSVTGALPAGIVFNKTTGVLSGRPTATKTAGYALSFKAINAFASSAATPATLLVNIVPQTAVGIFAGPMARSSLNDNLGGRFDLTTTATGTFSGGITLGARKKLSFTAKLLHSAGAGDVILYGSIPGIAMADKTPLTAYVEVFAAEQYARLTLLHPNGTTLVTDAWRKPWLLSKTPALNQPATDYAASYTARLDAGQGGTVSPDGYGYTSFTVSTAGTLTLAGKLPDGSAVSGGTHVGPNGEVMLFNLLYSNRGSHVGRLDITKATPLANNTLTGTTSWFKPAPLTATSTDTVYKAGFGPLNVDSQGGVYVPPTAGNLVMGLPVVPSNQSNAKISFSEGGIATLNSFHQSLRFFTKTPQDSISLVGVLPPLTNSTQLTAVDSKKGTFSGSFTIDGATPTLNRPAPFFGQIVKIGATTEGYGYFLLPKVPVGTEKVMTSPKLSGRVVLGVP